MVRIIIGMLKISNELEKQIKAISKWCNKWGFKINEDKTVVMIFTRKSADEFHSNTC